MKTFLLILWQLPQVVIGFLVSRIWKKQLKAISENEIYHVRMLEKKYGVKIYAVTQESHDKHPIWKNVNSHSWGRRICIVYRNAVSLLRLVKHEYGHSLQSIAWGWLYLPVIGFVSAIRCVMERYGKLKRPYMEGFPENDANRRAELKVGGM